MTDAADITFPRRMSPEDALAWRVEKDPILRSTIIVLMTLEKNPDRERVYDKLERATRVIPRLRQRVLSVPFGLAEPVWAVDPYFDVDYHVRFVKAAGDTSHRGLLDMAARIGMQAFDRYRPLWEVTVVEDTDDGAAMILKLHHSVTDGVGGVMLMARVFDFEENPAQATEVLPPEPPGEHFSASKLIAEAVRDRAERGVSRVRALGSGAVAAVESPLSWASDAAATAVSIGKTVAPTMAPMSPVMTRRSPTYHYEMFSAPLPEMKAAAKRADVKLNAVFVTSIAAGLRRYHLRHGERVAQLRMSMPINLRTAETETMGGNQFTLARFPIPIEAADVDDRLRTMHQIVVDQRHERALDYISEVVANMNRLPTSTLTALFGSMAKGVDVITSNVPGLPIPVYTGGAKVTSIVPFGPTTGAAINITLLSYAGEAAVSANVDTAAVPDHEVLFDCIHEGFDEVLGAGILH